MAKVLYQGEEHLEFFAPRSDISVCIELFVSSFSLPTNKSCNLKKVFAREKKKPYIELCPQQTKKSPALGWYQRLLFMAFHELLSMAKPILCHAMSIAVIKTKIWVLLGLNKLTRRVTTSPTFQARCWFSLVELFTSPWTTTRWWPSWRTPRLARTRPALPSFRPMLSSIVWRRLFSFMRRRAPPWQRLAQVWWHRGARPESSSSSTHSQWCRPMRLWRPPSTHMTVSGCRELAAEIFEIPPFCFFLFFFFHCELLWGTLHAQLTPSSLLNFPWTHGDFERGDGVRDLRASTGYLLEKRVRAVRVVLLKTSRNDVKQPQWHENLNWVFCFLVSFWFLRWRSAFVCVHVLSFVLSFEPVGP